MFLYGLLVMFAFYSVYITYAILVNPQGYSLVENMVMGGLFSVGLGFSTFCLLKGNRQMQQGFQTELCVKYSKRVRSLFRIAQITAGMTCVYFILYSIDPHAVARASLHILILVGFTFLFFALAVFFQQRETKAMKRVRTLEEQKSVSAEYVQVVKRFRVETYLKTIGWMAVFLIAGYILLVYFGSEIIPATPLHILGLTGVGLVCFLLVRSMKRDK